MDSWRDIKTAMARFTMQFFKHPIQHIYPLRQKTRFETYKSWRQIIRLYSKTDLTKPADRLIALSGIAGHYQEMTGDHYLAGLWRRDFVNGLLWFPKHNKARPRDYRAPSWSWAAIDGWIEYRVEFRHKTLWAAKLIRFETALVNTNDATGAVRGGNVTMKGKLVSLPWTVDLGSDCLARADFPKEINGDMTCLILDHVIHANQYKTVQLRGILISEVEQQSILSKAVRQYQRKGYLEASGYAIKRLLRRSRDAVVTLV
jgi:hypothetical protein